MKNWRMKEEVFTLTYMLFGVPTAEAKKARVKYNGSDRWSEVLISSLYLAKLEECMKLMLMMLGIDLLQFIHQ